MRWNGKEERGEEIRERGGNIRRNVMGVMEVKERGKGRGGLLITVVKRRRQ